MNEDQNEYIQRYPSFSVEDFYDEDVRRSESREIYFGDDWALEADEGFERHLHWLSKTGEFFAFRVPCAVVSPGGGGGLGSFGPTGGLLTLTRGEGEERIEVLGVFDSRHEIETRMEGWQSEMGGRNGMEWVTSRVAAVLPVEYEFFGSWRTVVATGTMMEDSSKTPGRTARCRLALGNVGLGMLDLDDSLGPHWKWEAVKNVSVKHHHFPRRTVAYVELRTGQDVGLLLEGDPVVSRLKDLVASLQAEAT